jgi:hypothetical protein
MQIARQFRERFVGDATPRALGAIRVVVCCTLLISALWEDPANTAVLPLSLRQKMGLLEVLYSLPIGFEHFVQSAAWLTGLKWVTALLLVAGALGFKTRLVLPLAAFCYAVLGGIMRQYAWFFHTGLVPLYVLIGLSFMPARDGLSLDAWLLRRRDPKAAPDPDVATPRYGWARYVCWALLALPYMLAGFSKLRDGWPPWWTALNFKRILLTSDMRPMHFDFDGALSIMHAPDWFFGLLGFGAVMSEITYVSVLFSRWARLLFPPMMMLMHVGILYLQNILFFDLILLQLMFVDWDGLFRRYRKLAPAVPAPDPRKWSDLRYALPFGALVLTLGVWWVTDEEYYPFTCMQMFTGKVQQNGLVKYEVLLARDESGRVFEARLEHVMPALRDTRYRKFIRVFDERGAKERAREFLDVAGAEWNRKAAPGERVVEFEIQTRVWNFLTHPDAPERARVKQKFLHPLQSERLTQQ